MIKQEPRSNIDDVKSWLKDFLGEGVTLGELMGFFLRLIRRIKLSIRSSHVFAEIIGKSEAKTARGDGELSAPDHTCDNAIDIFIEKFGDCRLYCLVTAGVRLSEQSFKAISLPEPCDEYDQSIWSFEFCLLYILYDQNIGKMRETRLSTLYNAYEKTIQNNMVNKAYFFPNYDSIYKLYRQYFFDFKHDDLMIASNKLLDICISGLVPAYATAITSEQIELNRIEPVKFQKVAWSEGIFYRTDQNPFTTKLRDTRADFEHVSLESQPLREIFQRETILSGAQPKRRPGKPEKYTHALPHVREFCQREDAGERPIQKSFAAQAGVSQSAFSTYVRRFRNSKI